MSAAESNIPLEQRYLYLQGHVSLTSLALARKGLPQDIPPYAEILFAGYTYADLPLPKNFEVVFPLRSPHLGVLCDCRVIAATQQMSFPLTELPHGWKTICVIEFVKGTPEFIRQLPELDGWDYDKETAVGLCDIETWKAKSR